VSDAAPPFGTSISSNRRLPHCGQPRTRVGLIGVVGSFAAAMVASTAIVAEEINAVLPDAPNRAEIRDLAERLLDLAA